MLRKSRARLAVSTAISQLLTSLYKTGITGKLIDNRKSVNGNSWRWQVSVICLDGIKRVFAFDTPINGKYNLRTIMYKGVHVSSVEAFAMLIANGTISAIQCELEFTTDSTTAVPCGRVKFSGTDKTGNTRKVWADVRYNDVKGMTRSLTSSVSEVDLDITEDDDLLELF